MAIQILRNCCKGACAKRRFIRFGVGRRERRYNFAVLARSKLLPKVRE